MMSDMQRIRGALDVIQTSTAGTRGSAIRWNLAWRDALKKIRVSDVLKSCKTIHFEGSDGEKREAKIASHLVKRAWEFAKQVDEIERELADLYPADLARRRLDNELGWEHKADDSLKTKLDRTCMIARVNAPPTSELRHVVHGIVRGRFSDLDMPEAD